MHAMRSRHGQGTLEYILIFCIIVAAILAGSLKIKAAMDDSTRGVFPKAKKAIEDAASTWASRI